MLIINSPLCKVIQCLANTDSSWAFELYCLFEGFVKLKWTKLTKCSSLNLAYSESIAGLEFYLSTLKYRFLVGQLVLSSSLPLAFLIVNDDSIANVIFSTS